MFLSGFADEAAEDLAGQIAVTQELGWEHIEIRSVDGINVNDLEETAFDRAAAQLADAGVRVSCLGSTIANWGKTVLEDFTPTLAAVDRAVRRMRRLGAPMVRIMSYAVFLDKEGRALPDQMEKERFRRLREICRRFTDAGLTPVHENCLNYGGMDVEATLRLLREVPGLKLVFDTGNPPLTPDFSRPYPYPRQSAWEFYRAVREHIVYVHIKDGRWLDATGEERYTYPGEGDGDVRRIVKDLLDTGYDGGFSIEPHMEVVFHHAELTSSAEKRRQNYAEYGRRFMAMLAELGKPVRK